MVLTASHQTTGRQALQHTTDAHDRETARRPLGVWREKILRTPTGVLKGAENGTGFWTHVEQLRTFLGAQSGVLLAQHEPQRCPDTRSHNETGASTLHLQVCAPQRGSRALWPPGSMPCCCLHPPLLSHRNAAHAHAQSRQQGRSGQEPLHLRASPRTGWWCATCKEVTLAGAVEADNAVVHGAERPAHGLFAVRLEAMDPNFLDVHAVCLGLARQELPGNAAAKTHSHRRVQTASGTLAVCHRRRCAVRRRRAVRCRLAP